MTARVKKEFRVLLTPWSVAILAAFSLPVVTTLAGRMSRKYVGGLPLEWIGTLISVSIFVACLAMAAMSFGVEIHHRTFGLMLVQPLRRSRIWWSKMLPLIGAYISVGAAFVGGQYLAHAAWGSSFKSWDGGSFLAFVALLAGVMCSSAFWTLQSRSIIGGMVLPLAMQALLAGGITWFASGTSMFLPEEPEPGLFPALGAGAFVYCLLSMYLGWWKFSRLEWREGLIGESVMAALPNLRVKESQPAAPRGPWASLLRKELRLHRPVFYLAALFVVCWLAALGLRALRPAWEVQFEGVFGVILLIYLPLAWLLSGCISLGEEKQLGAWGWHLTLPVSGARQWAVKISFALLTALILGILIPALACLAANAPNVEIPEGWWWGVTPFLLALSAAICGTVLSFWSVTMFGTVVRAILFTFLGAGVFLFGGGMMLRIGRETLLFTGFYRWLMVEFQLPPHYPFSSWIIVAGSFIGLSLLLVLLLRQSYMHCRREPSRGVIIRCSLILVLALFLPIWLSSDISYSCSYMSPEIYSLSNNLGEAISKLPASIKEDAVEKSRPVSLEEIDGTGMLSPETGRWLRGASIRIMHPVAAYSAQGRTFVHVEVTFPNGRYLDTALFIPW
jgi:hypothetical protein